MLNSESSSSWRQPTTTTRPKQGANKRQLQDQDQEQPLHPFRVGTAAQRLAQWQQQQRQEPVEVPDSDQEEEQQSRLLSRGVSIVSTRGNWKSEQYAVRQPFVKDIIMRLNVGTPVVDAFATAKNKRWAYFWGQGNDQHPDGFAECWTAEVAGLIWANPPFSQLDKVVKKAKQEGARMILIAPDWRSEVYYTEMWPVVKRHYYYEKGTQFFELNGKAVGGLHWGVWAVYLDCTAQEDAQLRARAEEVDQRTNSSRRRWRRRLQKEAQQ
jgi:hypothetical protein